MSQSISKLAKSLFLEREGNGFLRRWLKTQKQGSNFTALERNGSRCRLLSLRLPRLEKPCKEVRVLRLALLGRLRRARLWALLLALLWRE
jgi:hypothetical protein